MRNWVLIFHIRSIKWRYHEPEGDGDDDGVDDGDGGEVEATEVAGEGLGDDGDGEQGNAAEDGRGCYLP